MNGRALSMFPEPDATGFDGVLQIEDDLSGQFADFDWFPIPLRADSLAPAATGLRFAVEPRAVIGSHLCASNADTLAQEARQWATQKSPELFTEMDR